MFKFTEAVKDYFDAIDKKVRITDVDGIVYEGYVTSFTPGLEMEPESECDAITIDVGKEDRYSLFCLSEDEIATMEIVG